MKKILTLAACFVAIGLVQSQSVNFGENTVSKLNVSGKWVGKRHQYNADRTGILQTFEYEFNLKQEGNIVTGTTLIYSHYGDFGEMKLRGIIAGNKLIFEEYEIVMEHQSDPNRTWCFKTGELVFAKEGNRIKLLGATPSFIPYYNYPCTGGYTHLEKADDGNAVDISSELASKFNEADFSFRVSPNPFVTQATVSFNLTEDANVDVRVLDLSGKEVAHLLQGKVSAGNHELIWDANKSNISAANYVVVLKINNRTYSALLSRMQ